MNEGIHVYITCLNRMKYLINQCIFTYLYTCLRLNLFVPGFSRSLNYVALSMKFNIWATHLRFSSFVYIYVCCFGDSSILLY